MLRFTPSLPANNRLPDLLLPVPLLRLAAAARVSSGITPSSGTRPKSARVCVPGVLWETPAPAGRREPRRCFPASPHPCTKFPAISSRPPFFPPFFGGYWSRPFSFSSQEFNPYFWPGVVCGGRELYQELVSAYPPSPVCWASFFLGLFFWRMWTVQSWAWTFWCITSLLWTWQVNNYWTLWISPCSLWFLRIAKLHHFSLLFWMCPQPTVCFWLNIHLC